MANIWIENHGVYTVRDEKVQDLLAWLRSNEGVKAEGSDTNTYDGATLLNEDQKGANVGKGPSSEPGKNDQTFEFGGTWM